MVSWISCLDIFFHIEQKIEKPVHPCGKTGLSGTPEGIRTPDLLVRSQTLYPTELAAHLIAIVYYHNAGQKSTVISKFFYFSPLPGGYSLPAALLPTVFCRLLEVFLFFGGVDKYFLRRVPLCGFYD